MNLQVIYCNHQTASLDIRERLAFTGEEQLADAYTQLRDRFPNSEAVVLSTCNRVELYTAQENAAAAPTHDELAGFLSNFHGVPVEEFLGDLLQHSGAEAVGHLFRVCSSIDSMVLGEPQIVSQVKEAYRQAEANEACGPLTNALFQCAIRVSKRVRSETRLAEGRVSIASVAVGEFARGIFDRFDDKTVLVIGAGEMAEETLQYLQDDGVRDVLVVNRNPERARELAAKWGGDGFGMDRLEGLLPGADVVVAATGADQPIVDVEMFARVRDGQRDRPVFVLDLGAPRDVAPEVSGLDDNVFLYDVDDLQETCERNRKSRSQEIVRALSIIENESDRFMQDVYHRATGPIVKRLREQWSDVSQKEMDRLRSKLSHLGDADIDQVEQTVNRIVNKLLHPPLEALRDEARDGTPHGLLDALSRLFHIRD
ncbi:MAG: glutamyl-tRNA reductase [Planctomycetaceae bacterium]|nr:glutamyl-tRNA reductase [Planctomycetaceae bacterium]|tara:strand:+ start:1572 stop:2852 length:1281 start_codon:yes stop_codon:yes gene_type:complete